MAAMRFSNTSNRHGMYTSVEKDANNEYLSLALPTSWLGGRVCSHDDFDGFRAMDQKACFHASRAQSMNLCYDGSTHTINEIQTTSIK